MHTRVARLYGAHDLRVEEQEVSRPGPGEVLLRMAAGGICGSDLHYYHDGGFGPVRVREPISIAWVSEAGLRDEIIVNPATTVVASFDSPQAPQLDRAWLNRLMIAANSVRGLNLTPQLVQSFRLERDAAASAAADRPGTGTGTGTRALDGSGAAGPGQSPSLHSVPPAAAARSGQPMRRRTSLTGD